MAEFKKDQKVRLKSDSATGKARTISFIDGNIAVVKDSWGTSKLVKLSDLVDATPKSYTWTPPYVSFEVKPAPLKPGWYAIRGQVKNFIYYCKPEGGVINYYMAYNPNTGEMDFDPQFPVAVPKMLIGVNAGDLTRMKFVPESGLTVSGLRL